MKKLIPILLAVFALVSCEKDPDMDKLDNEYLVFTSHDTSTKFNDFSTYYIPDSILIIGDKKDPEYWKDENAQTIINAFKTKMNAAGYTAAFILVLNALMMICAFSSFQYSGSFLSPMIRMLSGI